MSSQTAQISNPNIFIKPSKKLKGYIRGLRGTDDLPAGVSSIFYKNPVHKRNEKSKVVDYLITPLDRKFLKSISINTRDFFTELPSTDTLGNSKDKLLSLQDLHWLYEYIQTQNHENKDKIYLHQLLEGSDVILPKNKEVPRNPELEQRCRKLKAEQENRTYQKMTKNVDPVRRRYPEDSIGYQLKQLNRHFVAIFQFVLSVAAGFAFGFIGVELLIGSLDFGFRLLLGIICALTIALAELYFLAKKLNEDLQFEYFVERQQKSVKLD